MLAAAAQSHPPTVDLHFLLQALVTAWPLAGLATIVGTAKLTIEALEHRRLRRSGIYDIDRMSGAAFEERLAILFRNLGYRVERVGSSRGDFGGDLLISKAGKKTVVQAKCWSKPVGVKAVQEARAAQDYYGADSAVVVTNRSFTRQATELAGKANVGLHGREWLVRALNGDTDVRPEPVTRTVSSTCAACGGTVSERVRAYCASNAGRFGGLTYCYAHQRSRDA